MHGTANQARVLSAGAKDSPAERKQSHGRDRHHLTRQEAAAACGVSFDTIRRRIKAGLPSEKRDDGVVQVAITDLVQHGLLDPLSTGGDITGALAKNKAERQLDDAQQALAVAGARVLWLQDRLSEYKDETTFLRGLLKKTAA